LPGPWYTRFTHLRLKRAVVTGQRIFYIDNLHKQYGPIVRLSPTEVGVADLDAFKEIHRIGTKYMKSSWYLRLANFPKPGVFTMLDPREHGARRKLLSRPFSRSYLVENWEATVREKALLAVTKIKQDAQKGTADVYNWWMLLASDISAHLAFGESFNMLETGHVRSTPPFYTPHPNQTASKTNSSASSRNLQWARASWSRCRSCASSASCP
jgi:cytochrome P450